MALDIPLSPTASTITAWLQGQPDDPTAYATGANALSARQSILSKPPAKRKVLDEILSNAMPEKKRKMSPSKAGLALFEEPQTPLQSHRGLSTIPSNDDDTPRVSENVVNMPGTRETNYVFSTGQTSPSRASTSSSARAHSPLKRMGDLQFMERRITAVRFENTMYALPAAAKELLEGMRKIARGKQIIPDCLKVIPYHHLLHSVVIGDTDCPAVICRGAHSEW